MTKCNLSFALRDYVYDEIDSFGECKNKGLDFFILTLTNRSSFNNIRKALADAKDEAYSKNEKENAVFVFFKPLDRQNADESKIPNEIKNVFRRVHDFNIPDDDEIVKIEVKGYAYWAVKLEFK